MIIRRINWRKVAATIVVCLIPVAGYAAVFYLEHGQFARVRQHRRVPLRAG